MSKKQIILILAVTLVAILVAEMPFNHKVAEQLNVLSAYLCEQIMNGMGVLVMRHVNLVQTLVKSPPIKFDFQDGYWMLKQFYLLLPFSLLVAFYFKYPFRKIFPVGLIALLVCLFLRTLILVINASCFGQQFAAGWIDTLVRIFVAFATIAIVFYVAAKTKKVKEDESAPSDTSDLSDKKPGP